MSDQITLVMGILSFVGGLIALYGAAIKKQYASERDFNHLKRNYENLTHNVETLSKMEDQRFDDIEKILIEMRLQQSIMISLLGGSSAKIAQIKE